MHVPEGGKEKKNLSHHVDPCRVVLVQTHPRPSSSIFKLLRIPHGISLSRTNHVHAAILLSPGDAI